MASFLDGFFSLGADANKAKEPEKETQQGVVSGFADELSLDKPDTELVELAKKWEQKWISSEVRKDLERKQDENEKYWKGDHHTLAQKTTGKRELVDNLIFEAIETFLPVATRNNPEPVVQSDESDGGRLLAKKVADRLVDLADTLRLKLKLKKVVRHWALYYLGVAKVGWSQKTNEIALQVKRPQQLVLDPEAITDECDYDGEYLGEYKTETASDIVQKYPDKEEFIKKIANNQLGTKLRYIEWWTPSFVFWSLKDEILGKAKNPHWNYEQVQDIPKSVDEFGLYIPPSQQAVQLPNFFSSPKVPYVFLSIFNLGKGPVDDSSLIEQVIPLQDVINKRQRQIDKNADRMNAGAILSGDSFSRDQAKQAADAINAGKSVWVPRGNPNNAYKRDSGQSLPPFVYQSLIDYRNELRSIFGTTGLSSPGIKSEDTVRGKILVKGTDQDRATLVIDHVEQFVDCVFNWMVQLMYVYYDSPRSVSRIQGSDVIVRDEFVYPLVVSVKAGSLIPKDRLTLRNEAIDLWSAQALDPLTLFERLEDPNPQQSAQRLILWKTNPLLYAQTYGGLPQEALPPPVVQGGGGAVPPSEEQPKESANLLSEVPIQ